MTLASWTWAHWTVSIAWLTLVGYGIRVVLSRRTSGVRAKVPVHGCQEATVFVRDGHTSEDIIVRSGRPVRLVFARDESAFRSERIVLSGFDKTVDVSNSGSAAVVVHPRQPGEYPFECDKGLFRGRLVVE